ncbi:hypothetical protein GXW77_18530 [Roseomonas alkaliterrae]|uniref:hypothetical protein n=1 Tax=Neoroseomonas alkaliterrae TaxID=1452450 RepID=UPI001BA5078C|nr:hypothetical protein [Neoroseomonas alkaliterrae]MBR0678172.1 hypothetical protein [Neoroseomonas alkaliterrae]
MDIAVYAAIASAIAAAATAGSQIMQAQQQGTAQRNQAALDQIRARQQELEARGVEARGTAEALDVRENLLRTLAAQNARYAASGLMLEDGTPGAVAEETRADAERQLDILRTNTTIAAESARIGAAQTQQRALLLRDQAGFTTTAGYVGAAATAARAGLDAYNRWPGTTTSPGGGAVRTRE